MMYSAAHGCVGSICTAGERDYALLSWPRTSRLCFPRSCDLETYFPFSLLAGTYDLGIVISRYLIQGFRSHCIGNEERHYEHSDTLSLLIYKCCKKVAVLHEPHQSVSLMRSQPATTPLQTHVQCLGRYCVLALSHRHTRDARVEAIVGVVNSRTSEERLADVTDPE